MFKNELWVEKYRPDCIADCILSTDVEEQFKGILKTGIVTPMLMYGSPGTGKTTSAIAICKELGLDWTIVNASNERGMDVIRDKIMSFASTVSLTGNGKCFILDEGDHLLPATQAALRGVTEELSGNCSFIITANYPNRMIDAIHSRFNGVNFNLSPRDAEVMQAKTFMRVIDILTKEGVEFDESVVVSVVKNFFPDIRKILNRLQQYAMKRSCIDEGILTILDNMSVDVFVDIVKNRKFKDLTQWAVDNSLDDTSMLYENIYKAIRSELKNDSIPDVILVLEDYQRSDAMVPSKELHLTAMGTELMATAVFK